MGASTATTREKLKKNLEQGLESPALAQQRLEWSWGRF